MGSRESILQAVLNNQPELSPLPEDIGLSFLDGNLTDKFIAVATGIGSTVIEVSSMAEIKEQIPVLFEGAKRVVSALEEFAELAETGLSPSLDPHTLEDVDVAILRPHFAVAENAACWITEDQMGHRVLPFICQHLVMIVYKSSLLATMHHAYSILADKEYGFATFIAGPSKTADIEQSLVLGAHGPRSLTVFLVG